LLLVNLLLRLKQWGVIIYWNTSLEYIKMKPNKNQVQKQERSNQHRCICSKMASVQLHREEIWYLSMKEVVERRRELMKIIHGDAFFPLKSWPKEMKLFFWKKKTMKDEETFKLLLFLIGNGCSPDLIQCPSRFAPPPRFGPPGPNSLADLNPLYNCKNPRCYSHIKYRNNFTFQSWRRNVSFGFQNTTNLFINRGRVRLQIK